MFDYLDMCDVILSGNMSFTGLDQDHVPDEITWPINHLCIHKDSQDHTNTLSHCLGGDQNFHWGAPRQTKYLMGFTPLPGRKKIWMGAPQEPNALVGWSNQQTRKKILGLLYGTPCYLRSWRHAKVFLSFAYFADFASGCQRLFIISVGWH